MDKMDTKWHKMFSQCGWKRRNPPQKYDGPRLCSLININLCVCCNESTVITLY